jgi:sulfonate transport system substrate-binding protein
MKKYKLYVGLFLFFLLVLTSIWLVHLNNDQSNKQRFTGNSINIGYFSRAIGYAPYFVAQSKGWFEEHPTLQDWKINHTIYGDRPTISDAFDSGDLQVLLSAEIPAIMCRAQGNDIRIVAITGYITLKWLVNSDFGVKSIIDLKGKKVAYQSGTSSHYGLLTTLNESGVNESDFILRNMRAVEAETAFEESVVDSWVVWSPFFEQQIISGKGLPVKNSEYNYTTTMTISKPFIDDNNEVVNALIEILDKSKTWIQNNSAEADTIVAKATLQSIPVAHLALKNVSYSDSLTTMSDDHINLFQSMSQFLADNNATRNNLVVNIRSEMIVKNEK